MKPLLLLLLTMMNLGILSAANASFWDELLRAGARSDEVFEAAAKTRRVAVEVADQRRLGKLAIRELDEISSPAARAQRARTLIREAVHLPDESLLKRLDGLTPNELESAYVLVRGGRNLVEEVPDVAFRSRLLKEGGSDLVTAAGIHGPVLAREASRMDALIAAGKLPGRIGKQNTIARFGKIMRSGEGGAWRFWEKNVVPHWKKWLAAGAVTTYLMKPDLFHDAAGNLTEAGSREVATILGEVISGAMKGAGDGGSEALEQISKTFTERYLHGF
ncbi:MAG: hypothetical protein KDN05_23855, partial [Verrucomicrobiae bacterium]|nr:hypothetical protein [Verrucomicrobiae bacterium]